jgi:hypothetical protein
MRDSAQLSRLKSCPGQRYGVWLIHGARRLRDGGAIPCFVGRSDVQSEEGFNELTW